MPKHFTHNPRKISAREKAQLAVDLAELGDLGGFVHCLNSDEIVSGNQRAEAIRGILEGTLLPVITQTYDPPNAQGTVAVGYVEWRGEQFKYRQVRWDADTRRRANIRANAAGGVWDFDVIANAWDTAELQGWGLDAEALAVWNENAAELATMLGVDESLTEAIPPDDFKEYDEAIDTEYCCPKCGYRWSGKQNLDAE
jgi:hypothetical protein